ncbi:hypothetical protein [Aeromonas hydrophila]|uniref:hypothetical protein n=1 Tax=Aeromonas hydrophila TaxID=644 RepID=UPI003D197531
MTKFAQTALRWPASAAHIGSSGSQALTKLPGTLADAIADLQGLLPRAQYRRHPLSDSATGLFGLRAELDSLLVNGRCLTVTPYQHGVGQQQGDGHYLAAPNAIAQLSAKLQDGADMRLPSGQMHAIAWLVTGQSADELAQQLAVLCAILPIPEWCATLRRLTANNDLMHQVTAAKVPRWRADEPLSWDPLRQARLLLGAEVAQLESLGNDAQTPIAKLQALAERRQARLDKLSTAITSLSTLSGKLWHWSASGDRDSLAAQLSQSAPPDHTMSISVATLLVSASPLTFWQELTP